LASSFDEISISDEPVLWNEIVIGLDYSECIFRIGKIETNVAVLFVKNPYFPVWLKGQAINKIFDPLF